MKVVGKKLILTIFITCLFSSVAQSERINFSEIYFVKKFLYVKNIDEQGYQIAQVLGYAYRVKIQNHIGLDLPSNYKPQNQLKLVSLYVSDSRFRKSVNAWNMMFKDALFSDFDSLSNSEFIFLSIEKKSQALLSSPEFWRGMTDISRELDFDIRPAVKRDLVLVQKLGQFYYAGALTIIPLGALAKVAAFLKISPRVVRGVTVAVGAGALGLVGFEVWNDFDQERDTPTTPIAQANQIADTTKSTGMLVEEDNRRLFIFEHASELTRELGLTLNSNSENFSHQSQIIQKYKQSHREFAENLVSIKPTLIRYRQKLVEDKLPVSIMEDDPLVRQQLKLADDFLIHIAELWEISGQH